MKRVLVVPWSMAPTKSAIVSTQGAEHGAAPASAQVARYRARHRGPSGPPCPYDLHAVVRTQHVMQRLSVMSNTTQHRSQAGAERCRGGGAPGVGRLSPRVGTGTGAVFIVSVKGIVRRIVIDRT